MTRSEATRIRRKGEKTVSSIKHHPDCLHYGWNRCLEIPEPSCQCKSTTLTYSNVWS